jgi:hypothetical protein
MRKGRFPWPPRCRTDWLGNLPHVRVGVLADHPDGAHAAHRFDHLLEYEVVLPVEPMTSLPRKGPRFRPVGAAGR